MYQRIKDLREDRDLKQKHLAEYLNCSQQVYSNYELGQRDIPTDVLIRLSQFRYSARCFCFRSRSSLKSFIRWYMVSPRP